VRKSKRLCHRLAEFPDGAIGILAFKELLESQVKHVICKSVVKPDARRVKSADEALLLAIKNRQQGPWNESEQARK